MLRSGAVLAILAVASARECDQGKPLHGSVVCDTTLSPDARARYLVGMLQPSEKIPLLSNSAGGVPRLGIDSYQWWSEALHGVAYSPGVRFNPSTSPYATSFPQVGLTASSFNRTLWASIGSAISNEARAMNNVGDAGLTFWAPNINIVRDPRWGRGQETPGEDPFLTASYAEQFVRHMQEGEDPRYLKVSSCCKHYYAYDLEDADGASRDNFNAIISKQDEADTYLPAFQGCVYNGRASAIMCSYNAVNGTPSCANSRIMTDIARKGWGFDGYITSDCNAIKDVSVDHGFAGPLKTCAIVLQAGTDNDCGLWFSQHLPDAVSGNVVTQAMLDKALVHLFKVQIRLGKYDPVEEQPYMSYKVADKVNTPENQQLALEAARQGIVLLKNPSDGSGLPFSNSTIRKVAMIGPSANATKLMQSNYYGQPPYLVTPVQGVQSYGVAVDLQLGCGGGIRCGDTSGFAAAVTAAQGADATVLVMGLDASYEGEANDRTDLTFPGHQLDLIEQVANASKGPVVVVVMAGGPLDMTMPKTNSKVHSILWAGYPGQSGGQAIADVIFGKHNPSGKLVNTQYPADFVNKVKMTDMSFRPNASSGNPGRTYRFMTTESVYPFGFGLSYTTFAYKAQQASISVSKADLAADVKKADDEGDYFYHTSYKVLAWLNVTVTNTGKVAGGEPVLAFAVPPNAGKNGRPLKFLAAFDRVHLQPGSSATVGLPLTAFSLSLADFNGNHITDYATWNIQVGNLTVPVNFQ